MKNGMAPVYGIVATNLTPEIVSDILKKHLDIYYKAYSKSSRLVIIVRPFKSDSGGEKS